VAGRIGFRNRLARAERAVVGAGMRLVAIVAERRVRRGLEAKEQAPIRHGLHVDIRHRRR
jgi:hypothetical protein